MSYKIREIWEALERIAPQETQEAWDNSGWQLGNPEEEATGVTVALDVTQEAIDAAEQAGSNVLITHHPLFFTPVRNILWNTPNGAMLRRLLLAGMHVISAHTNLDKAPSGVNHALADALGLENAQALPDDGIGLLCEGPGSTGREWIPWVEEALGTSVRAYGPLDKPLRRLIVCGGAGGDWAESDFPFDALVTSEIKHHQALLASSSGRLLIDAGHFETEAVVLAPLAAALQEALPGLSVRVAPIHTPRMYG